MKNSRTSLKFNFDVSAFRLLGRELITDRITALFEIVKNCYDANAENVTVEFHSVNVPTTDSKIIIRDDGLGMTLNDLEHKWMVIGTPSKRKDVYSAEPYRRRVVGKKGIGRFAVDKLGSTVILSTKTKDEKRKYFLETDWTKYEKLEQNELKSKADKRTYFTDVSNDYWFEESKNNSHGTTIEITAINDPWTEKDILKAYTQLSKLVSPIESLLYPFNITIKCNEYLEFKNKLVENNAISFATEEIEIGYNSKTNKQEVLEFSESAGELVKKQESFRAMGPVKFKFYYFDQNDKRKFQNSYDGAVIDGIRIYRDGLITTPFAEYALERDKERDILGIDKRRYSGFFEKISSRDILGFVDITDENNPHIIESTNRQDFVDNKAYQELRSFIIEQIEHFEEYLSYKKNEEREKTKSRLKSAQDDLRVTSKIIQDIKKIASPEVKSKLKVIESNVKAVEIQIKRGISDYIELQKEQHKQHNLYLSLMSLQDYATEISHVVRTSLSNISDDANFIKQNIPNPEYDDLFVKYASNIFNEMNKLSSAIEFMLSYAKSNIGFVEFDLRTLIENLFKKTYRERLEKEKIKIVLDFEGTVRINHNIKFFEDIFENLISNSIKALKDTSNKIIKCSSVLSDNGFEIYFSDNGYGVPDKIRRRIFNVYFTTTEKQGGAGLGLYIVKKRIESMKGTIQLDNPELKKGATFHIILPLEPKEQDL